jgi:hypothetical protein
MAEPSLDTVRSFLAGTGTDNWGRSLDEILRQPDPWLEYKHDFIQWLFPIDTRSGVNPHAPIVSVEAARDLGAIPAVASNLYRAFCRMAAFYGFLVKDGAIERAANYPSRAPDWAARPTHNDLRITRILRSLTLFGLSAEAQLFHEAAIAAVREYRRDPRVERFWAGAIAR